MANKCIDLICEQRIFTVAETQAVNFGDRGSFIHCPGADIEGIMDNFSQCWDDKPGMTTYAILLIPASDVSRLPVWK
jgi:hypothetical protein